MYNFSEIFLMFFGLTQKFKGVNLQVEVSPPDLPISKSTPFRALCFLKRAKSGPSELLPARRKTSDRYGVQDFTKIRDM